MVTGKRCAGAAAALASAVMLASCSAGGGGFPRAEACVSWVDFQTPQDAYDDADVVLVGQSSPADGSVDMFGLAAAVHEIAIGGILKGELPDAGRVQVASTPVTCTGGDTYRDGDPLDTGGDLILFLREPGDDHGDVWHLITPFDGVFPVPDDGSLPFETEPAS